MPPTLRAMVQLQRLLGMRPNEIFKMRVGDIDTTRENGLWYYEPGAYKTARFVGKIVFPLGNTKTKETVDRSIKWSDFEDIKNTFTSVSRSLLPTAIR